MKGEVPQLKIGSPKVGRIQAKPSRLRDQNTIRIQLGFAHLVEFLRDPNDPKILKGFCWCYDRGRELKKRPLLDVRENVRWKSTSIQK